MSCKFSYYDTCYKCYLTDKPCKFRTPDYAKCKSLAQQKQKQLARQRQIENNNIGSGTHCDDTANKAIAKIYYSEQKIADRGYRVMNDLKNNGNKPLKITIRFEDSGNNFAYPKNKEK